MIPFLLDTALRRERELRLHFIANLPTTPNELASADVRNIAAYLLLSHSLLEQHLESCVRYLTCHSRNNYRHSGSINRPLASIGMHYAKKLSNSETISRSDTLGGALGAGAIEFEKKISDNHGLKEKNICFLFETIGFDLSPHTVFVAECNEFGDWRGSFAHRNVPSALARNGIDPRLSVQRVEQLFNALEAFSLSFHNFATAQLRD